LVQDRVLSLAFDSSGRVWFGTGKDAIIVFNGETWKSYPTQNPGLVEDPVHTIAIDPSDKVWIGTSYGVGVSVFDGENWKNYTTQNSGLVDDKVCAIAIDSFEKVWLGTCSGGVSVFDGENWGSYTTKNSGLANDHVNSIAFDSSGRIWIGSYGVSVFDGETWKSYTTKNSGLLADSVYAIAIDSSDKVWIGTRRKQLMNWPTPGGFKDADGVSVFDGEDWEFYTTQNSDLVDDRHNTIAIDSSDRVWIGTYKGVSVFDGENWVTLTEENSGILNNDVAVIVSDKKGFMWIGTRDGINRVPISERFQISPFFTSLKDLFFSPKLSLWVNIVLLVIVGNVAIIFNDRRMRRAIDKQEPISKEDQSEEKKISKLRFIASPGAAGGLTSSVIVFFFFVNNVGIFGPENATLEWLILGPMLYGMAILEIAVSLILIGPLAGIVGVKVFKTKKVAFLSGFLASLILEIPFIWFFLYG
jgi:ligand-binding sensor domain-containing protein